MSPESIPSCFFCGRSLYRHRQNLQGHIWRRGAYVTLADLEFSDSATRLIHEPYVRAQVKFRDVTATVELGGGILIRRPAVGKDGSR